MDVSSANNVHRRSFASARGRAPAIRGTGRYGILRAGGGGQVKALRGEGLWPVSGSPICLPVSGSTTPPRDDALAFATERRSPDVILMRWGKDAPLGRQIERSVTIVITPILSGLHHCYARI